MTDLADCRGIWAAMEFGGPRTLEDLQIVADVLPADSVDYLDTLIPNRYASIVGIRRAASGEALPLFKLVKWTGPNAPFVNENGKFIDPNLEAKGSGKQRRCLFKAHVRLAAERIRGPFTSRDLRIAMNGWPESRTKKFTSIWSQLKRSGEIERDLTAYPDGAQCWNYKPNLHAARIRQYFKEHVGEPVSSTMFKDLVGMANGAVIRQALDLLVAEGYRITVAPVHRDVVEYRMEPPEAGDAKCA